MSSFGKADLTPLDEGLREGFIRKVYLILMAQFTLSAAVSLYMYYDTATKDFVQRNNGLFIGMALGTLLFLFVVFAVRHKHPYNFIALTIWTLMEAYILGTIVSFYDSSVVLVAFLLTAVIFVALTVFTFQSKINFDFLGPALWVSLWLLIFWGLFTWAFDIVETDRFRTIYSLFGTIIFSLFIIYDTHLIKARYSVDEYIAGAISLYLDVLNLFLFLLSLLSGDK